MNALERYWLAPIPAARAWFVLKSTLLLFAIDIFAEHLRPAWRYGTADFNVAHFGLFDLLPMPTTALYVGTLTVIGLLAFVAALSPRAPRPVLVAIAALYFWSWSCSMHDSYQHHYLLSLFFIAFALFPMSSTRDLFGWPSQVRPPTSRTKKGPSPQKKPLGEALPHGLVPRASAFGLVMVWTTSAIVYGYTAVSKSEAEWRTGEALRNLTRNGATIPQAIDFFATFGIEGDALWPFLGHSVIGLQVAIALGYGIAPLRDQASGTLARVMNVGSIVVLALSLSFHLGAEYMGLQIGWFSWYMILLALATFLPARMLSALVLFVSWPAREIAEMASSSRESNPVRTAAFALMSAILLVPVGMDLDLPGALAGAVVIALGLMGAALYGLMRSKLLEETRAAAFALMIGAALVPFSIRYLGGEERTTPEGQAAPSNDVRYDYYRFAGGDFRRRGEWARALDAYLKAEEYAPEGQSRRAQANEMRQRIEQDGPRRVGR
jgi:hypothetical protein